jgi:hypothetical protein
MTKMNKTTRKNRRQKGGSWFPWSSDDTTVDDTTEPKPSLWNRMFGSNETSGATAEENQVAPVPQEYKEEDQTKYQEQSEPVAPVEENLNGGNKKQPNPAFGGYLKGGKQKRRTTKKRAGGNKCKCGCRNCRCSVKNCKCKCADKRFKCICKSSTCGCKRTLKRRKH